MSSNVQNQIISDDLVWRITGLALLIVIVPYAMVAWQWDFLKADDIATTLQNIADNPDVGFIAWTAKFASKVATLIFATSLFLLLIRADRKFFGLALMALVLRSVETAMAGTAELSSIYLTEIANNYAAAAAGDKASYFPVAHLLLEFERMGLIVASFFFCLGNAMFFALFYKAQQPSLPRWVCVFCFFASIIVFFGLPLQATNIITKETMDILWAPTFYEIPLGLWLLFKGANTPKGQAVPAAA